MSRYCGLATAPRARAPAPDLPGQRFRFGEWFPEAARRATELVSACGQGGRRSSKGQAGSGGLGSRVRRPEQIRRAASLLGGMRRRRAARCHSRRRQPRSEKRVPHGGIRSRQPAADHTTLCTAARRLGPPRLSARWRGRLSGTQCCSRRRGARSGPNDGSSRNLARTGDVWPAPDGTERIRREFFAMAVKKSVIISSAAERLSRSLE